ncbi:GtrA family protein [Xanthomonas hortorum]|uniref:GtrA/DPMS transmembrane domain-containing protein n=1 Tax=Xanthomonas hortorum pv. gardneri TaxID=2754056 RepID=A0A6V7EKU0_9XANT|nr:GtrA family protein [Xanthomonas hortorum]APP79388.1 sugar transferase [Xanthomonas hortorum pv. gardneri]EGD20011.1 putative membrane protein [Xanthomonas hortorum ATCC 19865]KLA96368.1 sugar transferase [Xanthomonas hortorum pv. gardneri]KLA98263.1 sugar transferase [Xanthomonas hortorum pv. gardneri]KLB05499.1 sugar transferase [Xanthomonas hortorum pv. gardneri]
MQPDESPQAGALLRRHRPLVFVALRFLLGGALNTGITLVLYWMLLRFMHYQWAYLASFCTGILLSYLINTRYVFRAAHSWLKFAAFPLIYLVTYALGALALKLSVGHLGVPAAIGPLISIVITLPVSFILSKLLLQAPKPDFQG